MGLSVLAALRPDSWNFPLLVHAFGAMLAVAGLVTATASLALAKGEARLLRLGYFSLLAITLPGWIIMRIGAQWIYSKEGWDDLPDRLIPSWIGIGFMVADFGGLILLVSLIVGRNRDLPHAAGQGRRAAQGHARARRRSARGLRRRRVGDGRQAQLARHDA